MHLFGNIAGGFHIYLCEFVTTSANLVNSFQVKSHLQLLLLTLPLKRGYTPYFYSETRNFEFL